MKLKSVKITNYKSILDSKDISLEDGLTVFIGKNESGKSNILKAIQSINNLPNDKRLSPNHSTSLSPVINFIAVLSNSENDELNQEFGFDLKIKELTFNIKVVKPNIITFDTQTYLALQKFISAQFNTEFATKYTFTFNDNEYTFTFNDNESLFEDIEDTLKEQYISKYEELKELYATKRQELAEKCFALIPKITYLSEMTNVLPDYISTTSLEEPVVKHLAAFLEKESKGSIPRNIFETIFTSTDLTQLDKASKLDEISKLLTQFFRKNYNQYKLNFNFNLTSDGHIHIFVKDFFPATTNSGEYELGTNLYLKERSTGLNWFISFIITCNSFNSNEIFVLDEPGMNLHHDGQIDMLNRLQMISQERQIIICTHSPYLIDPDELQSVRLVEKNATHIGNTPFDETVVYSKLHDYTDQATIVALLDAIGHNITKGLIRSKPNALIVEGISDLLFIKAFYQKLNKELDFDIFYAKSANKMDVMDSLLLGLGLDKIVMLYDADNDGLRNYKEIEHKRAYSVFTHDVSDTILNGRNRTMPNPKSIEDILSKNDFLKFYLNNQTHHYDANKTNSAIAKEKGAKYLDTKLFLNNIMSFEFEEETIINITNLADKITEKFINYEVIN